MCLLPSGGISFGWIMSDGRYGFAATRPARHGPLSNSTLIGQLEAMATALGPVRQVPVLIMSRNRGAIEFAQYWQRDGHSFPQGYQRGRQDGCRPMLEGFAKRLAAAPEGYGFEWTRVDYYHPLAEAARQLAALGMKRYQDEICADIARQGTRLVARLAFTQGAG
jgi:hypothetical protein